MVTPISWTNDSTWGSIVAGSVPMLVTSSPLGSAALAPPPVLGPPPCCVQALTTSPTSVRSDRSGQMRLRVWVKIRLPLLCNLRRVRADSGPFSIPLPPAAGSACREGPRGDVPRKGRSGRRGLDGRKRGRYDVYSQLLVEGERRKRRGPDAFHLRIDGSLVVTFGDATGELSQNVEPRIDKAAPARGRALRVGSLLGGDGHVEAPRVDIGHQIRRRALANIRRDPDRSEIAGDAPGDLDARGRSCRHLQRDRHALTPTLEDPVLASDETGVNQHGLRPIPVRSDAGHGLLGGSPVRRKEESLGYARPPHENVIDDRLAIDGELDGLSHNRVAKAVGVGAEPKNGHRFGRDVVREKTRAVGETVERLREVRLQHRPGSDVDVSFEERLERRGPGGKEMDLEPPQLRRPEDVVLEGGEGDAARKPSRDRKRSRVYGLSRICGSLRRGRLCESVAREHSRTARAGAPTVSYSVRDAKVTGRQDLHPRYPVRPPPHDRPGPG